MSTAASHYYRLDLQYDGSAFHGWARQPGLPTVQTALEEALAAVLGEVPRLRVAGRTDAGVHAWRQVVSLVTSMPVDCESLTRSLNALTPPEVGILACTEAPAGFDARADALSRTYRYFVDTSSFPNPFMRRYQMHVPFRLDFAVLQAAAGLTVGRHDFRAFTPTETEHVFFRRTVLACSWNQEGCVWWLDIEADAFLRQMVRTLVGTMLDVARGRTTLERYASLLDGGVRADAGPTAPAHGLFLWSVKYDGADPVSALTPLRGSTIMPTCVSRRYGENLFG